jgi:hypothetical protein
LLTHPNRFKDLKGSLDKTENARSSGMWLLTFSVVKDLGLAISMTQLVFLIHK